MATSPNVENYTLGKGKMYFNRKISTGVYEGERALGNAPEFNFSMSIDKLDHYSSMAGIRAKDASVVTEITAQVSFTLDEITSDNLELLFFGSSSQVVQAAADLNVDAFSASDAVSCIWLPLSNRKVGIWTLPVGTVTGTFQPLDVLTGGTSTETATVREIIGNVLYITDISGDFQVGETVTGGTSAATATVTAVNTFDATDVVVHDGAYSTFYVKGTDFTIDSASGRLYVSDGSSLVGNAFSVTSANLATTYSLVVGLTQTAIEGELRFVSDNPRGSQNEINIWRADLTPDGDTAFIGEDWSTMGFTGEILKDSENHPSAPYFTMTMDE